MSRYDRWLNSGNPEDAPRCPTCDSTGNEDTPTPNLVIALRRSWRNGVEVPDRFDLIIEIEDTGYEITIAKHLEEAIADKWAWGIAEDNAYWRNDDGVYVWRVDER